MHRTPSGIECPWNPQVQFYSEIPFNDQYLFLMTKRIFLNLYNGIHDDGRSTMAIGRKTCKRACVFVHSHASFSLFLSCSRVQMPVHPSNSPFLPISLAIKHVRYNFGKCTGSRARRFDDAKPTMLLLRMHTDVSHRMSHVHVHLLLQIILLRVFLVIIDDVRNDR